MAIQRAAIYARYSSDLQRDRSIDDQIALCREYANRAGYEIVAIFSDHAVSGSSVRSRSGINKLLHAARLSEFQFVIAESLSRIARDQEDAPAIRKRLEFAGVKIVTTTDGVVSPLIHGLRTIIDSQYLDDMKNNTRRGLSGVVRDGRHPGGAIYGYRRVLGRPGELEIVREEAEIICRIFREYIAGKAPRKIAATLNDEGLPGPRSSYWRASTINGHTKRKTGILQNELYCGRLIWNRCYRAVDPDSGQRIWRYRPESEWQRNEIGHLRIIADDVFDLAQQLRRKRAHPLERHRRSPKRILSGLLRCGTCGGGMSMKDVDHGRPRIVCSRMREASSCANRRAYYLDEIERLVIGGFRKRLGTTEAISYFVECYNTELERAAGRANESRPRIERDLAAIDSQMKRVVASIAQGSITDAEAELLMPDLRNKRKDLLAMLVTVDGPVTLVPELVEGYLSALARFEEFASESLTLTDDGVGYAVRQLIETVTITPTPTGTTPGIIVSGDLTALVGGTGAG